MSSSTRTTAAAPGVCGAQIYVSRIWCCFILLLAFATLTASAQTDITATTTTTTVQFLGVPNPQNTSDAAVTAPLGSIVLQGTGISPVTGKPFRHLWVDDATSGICRIDPDLDSPGPYAMNLQTCPFKINGASVTGGPIAYDPTRNFLYFADEQRSSQGVMRIGYLAGGDSGHGTLDFNSVFILGGNTTGARFGGGDTGCPLVSGVPGGTGLIPHAVALSPLGDLYVGFKKNTAIVRFNSPGTASASGFGTCAQFIQQVATVSKLTNGLGFIGHDLWGSDGTSPFFIKNADTTCLVPPHAACVAPTDIIGVLAGPVGAAGVAVVTDQTYPAIGGNNVYFAIQNPPPAHNDVAWLGNASAADAAMTNTTIDTLFMGTITPAANPTVQFLAGLGIDFSDPANIVAYSADDYSGLGQLAKGQWFQSCQGLPPAIIPGPAPTPYTLNCPTPIATAVPGVPQAVTAVAGNSQVSLSWNPAQAHQPVTSYTVHNSFSSGAVIPDIVVGAPANSAFPPTSVVIPAVNLTTYGFEVLATNAVGSSAFSAESNHVTPPGTQAPNAPTACPAPPCASAGDTQAFVTFTVSTPNGTPITSYTVTAYIAGVAQPITATVPAPASGNTGSAVIGGLTNGTTYTFTVHATNVAGNSPEGPQTNAVTPSAASLPTLSITMSGPTSVTATPVQITYGLTVKNTSNFPATNVSVTHTLSTLAASITATGAVRDASGNVTITTTSAHFLGIGQSVVIAGVTDATFNGTFTITNMTSSTTFNYSQAGFPASNSGSGSATGLPTATILVAQPGQGSCAGGSISQTCSLGNLDPGASTTISVIVQMQSQPIINTATASGSDAAGTVLVNASTSKTTSPPAPIQQGVTTAVSVAGTPQSPNPNRGQTNNITWVVSDTTQPAAPNVIFTITHSAALLINGFTVTVNNGGVAACFVNNNPVNCAAPGPIPAGATLTFTTPSLGGTNKNGQKPPQTMTIIETTVAPVLGTFNAIGTVTFGPGGTDTLPSSKTVVLTVTR
ncbi:MAG TPA: fibronectin type III domain-containing protein [Candidatus Angelobacter sp.]|nr:fibronectin type III domain-containing protein [Candidatus Angelobacter sp.]